VRNPFRSEVEAYHFLLLTVAAFAAIALASLLGGPWAGVPTWAVLSAATAFFYLRRGPRQRRLRTAPAHVGSEDERRVVVLVNEAGAGPRVVEAIERAAAGRRGNVLVVSPALASPVRRWMSDLDSARVQAERRLDESLAELHASGIEARGVIGDEDPLRAVEDALGTFGADGIVICARPGARTGSAPADIVAAARERFALPIEHVAVEPDASRNRARSGAS
jgi:hypothetical protein